MCLGKTKFVKPNLNITSKELVYYQEFKKNRIYFGTPVTVPRNFSFVITKDGKVFDELTEDFVISPKNIPEATQGLKLYKLSNGKAPKFFDAETYFVNRNTFEKFGFETSPIELEDKEFGVYSVRCFGSTTFKVVNSKKLLEFLIPLMGIVSSTETQKTIARIISEKIARIIEKENPSAGKLYLKDETLLKTIYNKLSNYLSEIGVEIIKIDLTETKFPAKIVSTLSKVDAPSGTGIFGGQSFEEWQVKNPSETKTNKPKFVTIVPTGNKNGPFFKESMAPYFFADEPKEEETVTKKKSIWRNVDQIDNEEKSKQIVDLDDED